MKYKPAVVFFMYWLAFCLLTFLCFCATFALEEGTAKTAGVLGFFVMLLDKLTPIMLAPDLIWGRLFGLDVLSIDPFGTGFFVNGLVMTLFVYLIKYVVRLLEGWTVKKG